MFIDPASRGVRTPLGVPCSLRTPLFLELLPRGLWLPRSSE
jgi:hypothetical protein